jgi:hypothetical protein
VGRNEIKKVTKNGLSGLLGFLNLGPGVFKGDGTVEDE